MKTDADALAEIDHLRAKLEETKAALVFASELLHYNRDVMAKADDYAATLENTIAKMTADAARYGITWRGSEPEPELVMPKDGLKN